MKKRILLAVICILSVLCTVTNTHVFGEVNSSIDQDNVKNTIETFFKSYENAFDNEIMDFYSIDSYFGNNSENIKEKTLVKTILNRRIVLSQEYPGQKLKELNKQIKFKYDSIDIKNNTANVQVQVTKTFNYNISPDIESGERNNYTVMLKNDTSWSIVSLDGLIDQIIDKDFKSKNIDPKNIDDLNRYQENLRSDIKKFSKSFEQERRTPSVYTTGKTPSVSATRTLITAQTTYNRTLACNYAVDHAYNYNSSYYPFSSDCTNFTSQCLYDGGGIPEHFGSPYTQTCWYYTTSTNRSSSWTGATEFNKYIKSSVSKIAYSITNFNGADYGDMIQLGTVGSPYHSLIITGIVYNQYGRSDLLICCHSSDKQNYSLFNYFSSATKEYIHIIGGK